MQLTRQSKIAISILVACARSPEQHLRTWDAAAQTGASREHAAKVAHLLRRAGFVRSARGRHGGIGLARPAHRISLGEVLRHTQPEMSSQDTEFLSEGTGMLGSIVEAGWTNFVQLMDRFTIADLIADSLPQQAACSDCWLMKPRTAALQSSTLVQ